jgi:ABC-type glycerol-3-phosphate transport system permease component
MGGVKAKSSNGIGRSIGTGLKYAILCAYLAAVVFPMIWVVYTSAKSTQDIYQNPFGLPRLVMQPSRESAGPLVRNYRNAWVKSGFSRYFFNSVKVVTISLGLTLLFGAMAAYALARFDFFGRNALSLYFLSGLIIPVQLIVIPLFFQFSAMGKGLTGLLRPAVSTLAHVRLTVSLHDSHEGLILIYIAFSLPFTIFVLTAFFRTLPNELREAALMDGCSEFRVFWSVMMPIAKPGLVTAAIFNALGLWNEYLFGLVFINSDALKTLPLGLASMSMQAQYKSDFGLMFAGIVIVMLPTLLIYAFLQERLIKGIAMGAIKG